MRARSVKSGSHAKINRLYIIKHCILEWFFCDTNSPDRKTKTEKRESEFVHIGFYKRKYIQEKK